MLLRSFFQGFGVWILDFGRLRVSGLVLHSSQYFPEEEPRLKEVQLELESERATGEATWSEVFATPFYRNVVVIGCAIQFFQIMTGINAIVSFSGTLFKALGLHGIAFSIIPFVAFTAGNWALEYLTFILFLKGTIIMK